jgi:hypothetical protein
VSSTNAGGRASFSLLRIATVNNSDNEDSCIDLERFNDPVIKPVRDELAMLRYNAVKAAGFEMAAAVLEDWGQDEAREALINYAIEQNGDEDERDRLMNEICDYCQKPA